MVANINNILDFQAKGLELRSERQRLIASNIANADTPGFIGKDINFKDAMAAAFDDSSVRVGEPSERGMLRDGRSHPAHMPLPPIPSDMGGSQLALAYTVQSQPSMDGNSVDLDRERANFADNSVRYEATLRFINGTTKTILSAIQGQ